MVEGQHTQPATAVGPEGHPDRLQRQDGRVHPWVRRVHPLKAETSPTPQTG